jgi:phosphoribosylglycinamide formyltransferase-1
MPAGGAKRLRLGVLISGRGSNLQALIDAFAPPGAPAEVVLVLSNEPAAPGLSRARVAGIRAEVVDHRDHRDRGAFDRALAAALEAAGVDLVCLAGFMRILSDEVVDRWRDRLVNIHPSLLPAFPGLRTHERAIAAGVRFAGCTVHFVRPQVDSGPIIVQAAVPVRPDDTPATLAARVLEAEHRIYPLAVRWIAEGRVSVTDGRVVVAGVAAADRALINPG